MLSEKEISILEKSLEMLNDGNDLSSLERSSIKFLNQIGLLSLKPKIIVCNVDEKTLTESNDHTINIKKTYPNEKIITICADIEDQLSSLEAEEKSKFMKEIGLEKMGINKLIKEGYNLLGLETFFTSGKEESRAWTVKKNTLAPVAAGVIHTDFEKIRTAEAVNTDDFINLEAQKNVKKMENLELREKIIL